jgi:hypothetical protein
VACASPSCDMAIATFPHCARVTTSGAILPQQGYKVQKKLFVTIIECKYLLRKVLPRVEGTWSIQPFSCSAWPLCGALWPAYRADAPGHDKKGRSCSTCGSAQTLHNGPYQKLDHAPPGETAPLRQLQYYRNTQCTSHRTHGVSRWISSRIFTRRNYLIDIYIVMHSLEARPLLTQPY